MRSRAKTEPGPSCWLKLGWILPSISVLVVKTSRVRSGSAITTVYPNFGMLIV
ncbi:Uncharacterised protein [Mycobacteroides abscessus subsp. abscessus]|nr:Uncharacterised protein [Mycobacteroides abscessus subsp. abscessus]